MYILFCLSNDFAFQLMSQWPHKLLVNIKAFVQGGYFRKKKKNRYDGSWDLMRCTQASELQGILKTKLTLKLKV